MAITDPPKLDETKRQDKICIATLLAVKQNFEAGPQNRDRFYESLEALAFCVAVIIEGSGAESLEATQFFQKALKRNLTL